MANTRYFPIWRQKSDGVIAPDERLSWGQTIAAGVQHVVAMFGATVLAPILMGFDPNNAILFSGVGTLVFFVVTGGRVPSYLGSSFSFIGVVIAATAYSGSGPNANVAIALGGIIACGIFCAIFGAIVIIAGHRWVERLFPPVVTGAIVAIIGLNLAPIAVRGVSGNSFNTITGLFTVLAVGLVAVFAPGMVRRLPILLGGLAGYVLYLAGANLLDFAKPIDFSGLASAAWFGAPNLVRPSFNASAVTLIAPVAVVLVAENLGHIKAISAMSGRSLDAYIGRAFIGDGVATAIAGACGGTGVTTYAENMGIMAVTRIYSTAIFVVAGIIAICLGFSPKFGALILTIPEPVSAGLSLVVFGLISATAGRIWVEAKVDFSNARNLVTVAVALTAGAGDLTLRFGGFPLGGISTATFVAIILYHLLRQQNPQPHEGTVADASLGR